ncbi:MAG: hypothetical protein HY901_27075 [Deltaproteobacteria bacterium]|nr:hypothetical protein [Deltaproteobacteria bacterium]
MVAKKRACPTCGAEVHDGDFLCIGCETIVGPLLISAIPEPPEIPAVVRTLLAPPEATLVRRLPRPPPPPPGTVDGDLPSLATTKPFTVLAGNQDVPRVIAGVDLQSSELSDFDAWMVSFMDGRASVEALQAVSALSGIELQSVLRSLIDRGIIELVRMRLRGLGPAAPGLKQPRPRSESESPLQRAIALEAAGRTDRAIEVLEEAIAKSSAPAPLFNRLAIAVIKERRDLAAASALLAKALALDPNNEVYRANAAKVGALMEAESRKLDRFS